MPSPSWVFQRGPESSALEATGWVLIAKDMRLIEPGLAKPKPTPVLLNLWLETWKVLCMSSTPLCPNYARSQVGQSRFSCALLWMALGAAMCCSSGTGPALRAVKASQEPFLGELEQLELVRFGHRQFEGGCYECRAQLTFHIIPVEGSVLTKKL